MRIVADDKIPFLKGVLEPFAEVVYLPGDQITAAILKNADALLTRSITKCNAQLLHKSSVQFIASATIGDDHIDKDYCSKNNIQWVTAKGCNAAAVEQYVTSALLTLSEKNNFILRNKTIGIVGVGNIGSRIANVAQLLGMKVLLNDPPRERLEGSDQFVSLVHILKNADIISFHVPLVKAGEDKTLHLADENFFKQIAKKCILINTSRGNVVENNELKKALEVGIVSHSIIDVWEGEPEINTDLFDLVDIATPHIAGYSLEGKANGTAMVVEAVSKHFSLGLYDWYPKLENEKVKISIDGLGLSEQNIACEVFKQVYPIQNDDSSLRKDPSNFELLRREYNFRKENSSYILNLKNVSSEVMHLMRNLGFVVQNNN